MAGTTTESRDTAVRDSILRDLVIQYNKLVADVELIRAAVVAVATRLDADAGVSGTTYVSADCATIDTAAELTGAKIGDESGTAITE